MRWAPRTLRARVAIATAIVLAAVLGLVAWWVDSAVRRHAMHVLDEGLRREASLLASLVRIDGDQVVLDMDGQEGIRHFDAPRAGAYYQIDAAGRRPLRSPSLGDRSLSPLEPTSVDEEGGPRERIANAEGPFEPRVRVFTFPAAAIVVVGGNDHPSPGSPRDPVVVRVANTTAGVDVHLAAVRRALSLALPLGLLVGVAAAYLVAGRATAPIARISAEAAAIARSPVAARLDDEHVEGELRDLATTLNRAFDRLAATAAREKRFAADVAHELRTPLAALRSRVELALSRDRTSEEYREALRVALESGRRLEGIVAPLLLLARVEAGSLRREPLDLRAVVERAVESLRPAPEAASVDLRVENAAHPVPVAGDAVLLDRLVSNLVDNALRHGGSGRQVDVRVADTATAAEVTVLDRGPGLAPSLLGRLFERFARGDDSRARDTGGAGLGLAIALAIARLHGGDVTAAPREGGGAVFTVLLPKSAASA